MSEEEYEIPPFDIQIEIMKRLPVKSLLKFTSVSKQWKSIIHSSRFIADYNGRHIQPHQIFVGYSYKNYVHIFDDDDDDDISFLQRLTLPMPVQNHLRFACNKFIGYSQGLFGFHCYNYNNVTPMDDSVVIWKPSIRKSVFIPVPDDGADFVLTVCNATDPTILKTTCIFGSRRQVEIFTLSTGSWRTLSTAPPRESLQFTPMRVAIDRFIHWIVCDRTSEGGYLDNLILSYDITSEQFTELCLPPTLAPHTSISNLDLSKLRDSLVVLERDLGKHEIGVWMMMEPGVHNSFTKLYTVKPPYTRDFPTVVGFRKNGQPIIYVEFPSCKEALLFYERDLERFIDFRIFGYLHPSTAGSYMETLLLLDH